MLIQTLLAGPSKRSKPLNIESLLNFFLLHILLIYPSCYFYKVNKDIYILDLYNK